jgi:TonB-dependent SusC/RagA subfamily outer membrane receptor
MVNYYLPFLLFCGLSATAQTVNSAAPSAPTDTVRTFPNTLRLQGQEQPARAFLTIQDQLRTVAGVQVTPYDGSPGSGQVVRIRGASLLQRQAQPLYIIDGLPALNDALEPDQLFATAPILSPSGPNATDSPLAVQHAEAGASPLQLLPPESVESIEVLAGPAAVARYGALGANGVISIRTRRGAVAASQPLRVHYSAYAGVQQVRHRYDLLGASAYADVVNQAARNQGIPINQLPYASTDLGTGTDWQAEVYRLAGLQQHQLSLEGRRRNTAFMVSADYRQQSGVLRNASLDRYGLRLALDQHLSERLTLRATATLGQTNQRLPYVTGANGATRGALQTAPTAAVRTAGNYNYVEPIRGTSANSYSFNNPLALANEVYRSPRTRRLLAQVAADYQLAPGLTVQASANFQRTLLDADSFWQGYSPNVPGGAFYEPKYGTQTLQASQWAARLAAHYQRQLGRHHLGAEVDYQYQAENYATTNSYAYVYSFTGNPSPSVSSGYTSYESRYRLHRPWARLHYALDSTLQAEASLSYAHFTDDKLTQYYPAAQVSWQPSLAALAGRGLSPTLWVGAARTSVFGYGIGLFGRARLSTPFNGYGYHFPVDERLQAPLYTDQFEAGLRLGQPSGHFSGQVVAYQRQTNHALLATIIMLPSGSGSTYAALYDEGTIRNQGLELTGTANWRAGRVQGTTRLVASLNRNRIQGDEYAVKNNLTFDNHPVGGVFGYQQEGLTTTGELLFRDTNSNGQRDYADQTYLGSGIPAQLASLSQQLQLGRLALDMQLDGLFGYQVLNHQLAFLDAPNGFTNNATTVRNYWTPTNTATTVPAPGRNGLYVPISDRLLENGSHVRLSSLTLSYRLRQTATQDISVWVGAQNLFVLTSYRGYDPNVSSGGSSPALAGQDYGAVPVPRTWLLGVRASL